jgi:hypothetical protein
MGCRIERIPDTMTKKAKVKPRKTANRSHRFMHRCASGNILYAELFVPRPGCKTQFEAEWLRPPNQADLREQQSWLASLSQVANVIAGNHLSLRFVDTQGRPVEFSAKEMAT